MMMAATLAKTPKKNVQEVVRSANAINTATDANGTPMIRSAFPRQVPATPANLACQEALSMLIFPGEAPHLPIIGTTVSPDGACDTHGWAGQDNATMT